MYEIYAIVNDFNDKKYIGQTTKGIEKRFQQHKTTTKTRIGRSIHYHGAEHFQIKIIDTAETQEEADEKERRYIKTFNSIANGYNLQPGGILSYGEDYEASVGIEIKTKGGKLFFNF